MLTGVGGPTVRGYVGLLADSPACFTAVVVAATTALRVATRVPSSSRS